MNTRTTSTDFSRRCRDRVNQKFSIIRKILEPVFLNASDWNRFRIIERTLIVLKGENFGQEKTKTSGTKSNREACAEYRSKLNSSFNLLRDELENSQLDSSKYRLFSRAGILEASIDALKKKLEFLTFKPNPYPTIISRVPKRKLEDFENSIEKRSPTENSFGSDSPGSESDGEQPNFAFYALEMRQKFIKQQLLQHYFQQQIYQSNLAVNFQDFEKLATSTPKTERTNVFRPWM